jgi:hypothetical protein
MNQANLHDGAAAEESGKLRGKHGARRRSFWVPPRPIGFKINDQ